MVSAVAVTCVLGGFLMYRFIETPFMAFRKRRFPTNFPATPHTAAENSSLPGTA
jgi:peptidoglycan/LPS O-acetylase OafA/YrhL